MSVGPIPIPDYDPGASVTTPVRSLSGIVRAGVITVSSSPVIYYPEYARWLYMPSTADVQYMQWDGTILTASSLLGGIWHPIFSIAVIASGVVGNIGLLWGS